MTEYYKNLKAFIKYKWTLPEEENIVSELLKLFDEEFANEENSKNLIKDFIKNNDEIVANCSRKFKEDLKKLTTYITESKKMKNITLTSDIINHSTDNVLDEPILAYKGETLEWDEDLKIFWTKDNKMVKSEWVPKELSEGKDAGYAWYDGVWDETSVSISDLYGRNISEIDAKEVYDLLTSPKYKVKVRMTPGESPEEIIIDKLNFQFLTRLSQDIEKMNPDLEVKPISVPGVVLNKAEEVNTGNIERRSKGLKAEGKVIKRVSVIFENVERTDENGLKYKNSEKWVLEAFKNKEGKLGFKVSNDNKCSLKESPDMIKITLLKKVGELKKELLEKKHKSNFDFTAAEKSLRESLIKEIEEEEVNLTENTTGDIAIPETPLTKELIRSRILNFDPYKGAQNVLSGSKTKIQIEEIKEAFENDLVDKVYIYEAEIKDDSNDLNVMFESSYGKREINLDKNDFIKFVYKNVDTSNYMLEGSFDFMKYMESRPKGFQDSLIKSYIKTILKENIDDDYEIDNVYIDSSKEKMTLLYGFPGDEESRTKDLDFNSFRDFLESNDDQYELYYYNDTTGNEDYPKGFGKLHDWNNYWLDMPAGLQIRLIKKFVKQNEILLEGMKPDYKKSTNNYAEWKSEVATNTRNEFKITERITEGVLICLDKNNLEVGRWLKEGIGYTL